MDWGTNRDRCHNVLGDEIVRGRAFSPTRQGSGLLLLVARHEGIGAVYRTQRTYHHLVLDARVSVWNTANAGFEHA